MLCGLAHAGPTRSVLVETEPPGVTVYVGDRESEPAGTTPLEINLPLGETTMFLEIDSFRPLIKNVKVTKGKGILKQKFVMKRGQGTLVVKAKNAADSVGGLDVFVDGESKGALPIEIEIDAGPHQVQAKSGSRVVFEQTVQVLIDESATVSVQAKNKKTTNIEETKPDDATTGSGEESGEEKPDPGNGTEIEKVPNQDDYAKYFMLGVQSSFVTRSVTYQDVRTSNLGKFSQKGQIMLGAHLQIWPLAKSSIGALRGAYLLGQAEFGVPQTFSTKPQGDFQLKSSYRTLTAAAGVRVLVAAPVSIDIDGGWQQQRLSFSGDAGGIAVVPNGQISSIRLGGGLAIGSREIFATIGGHARLVSGGGAYVQDRFLDAKGSGFDLGAGVHFRAVKWLPLM
jgi:hypothetical protein